jgi:hypothetical protein
MLLIADADPGLALMLTSPGDIFRWWIRKVSNRAGPMMKTKANLSSASSHYIGYIPLELYQTALHSRVAGSILLAQTQA